MSEAADSNLDILIVDDEAPIRRVLSLCLEGAGHRVAGAAAAEEALNAAASRTFDLAFLDIRLGADSGLDLIEPMRRRFPWMQIVVLTAYATVESAVLAMQRGAVDYLAKPFSPEQVLCAIDKARRLAGLETRVEELSSRLARPATAEVQVLESRNARMQAVIEMAMNVAATDATILITGESGTGKTVLARRIHERSHRAAHPFVVVSCPSLSNELLESELFGHVKGSFTGAHRDYAGRIAAAQRGTLFLDEIGEMSPALQSKMLRFIQDREYESVGDTTTKKADVRLITATNNDLEEHVRRGRFREDLLFRLNVIEIELPPLREHPDDILDIANNLLRELAHAHQRPCRRFSEAAQRQLLAYAWPGNVRELRNVVERCVLLGHDEVVSHEVLPLKMARSGEAGDSSPAMNSILEGLSRGAAAPRAAYGAASVGAAAATSVSLDRSLADVEEEHIRAVLAATSTLEEAARILRIDQTTLYRRRKRYGMI